MIKLRLTYSGLQSASFSSFEAIDSILFCRLNIFLIAILIAFSAFCRLKSFYAKVLSSTAYSRLPILGFSEVPEKATFATNSIIILNIFGARGLFLGN